MMTTPNSPATSTAALHSLHKVQLSILRDLRHTPTARYVALQRPTGLESDSFKFHLRKLVKQGYVEKAASGQYQLTATGKEFANNLDAASQAIQKQPKLSVAVLVSRRTPESSSVEIYFRSGSVLRITASGTV